MTTADAPGQRQHLEWIDLAKGFCVAFVVLGHAAEWYMRTFTQDVSIHWHAVSEAFRPLRMPLLFGISGMLAASRMDRPLRDSWTKTGGLYVLYCCWTAIYCLKLALPGGRDGMPYPSVDQLLLAFALPVYLWYIWALPVYYLIAWVAERILGHHSVFLLVPLVPLSLAYPWIEAAIDDVVPRPLGPAHLGATAFNFLWFYAGLKGRRLWLHVAANGRQSRAAVAALVYAAIIAVGLHYGIMLELGTLAAPFIIWAALEVMASIPADSFVARKLRRLGRDTLPVYAMHSLALTALTFVVGKLALAGKTDYAALALQWAVPPLVTLGVILLCTAAGAILQATPLRFLVEPVAIFASRARDARRSPVSPGH